MRRLSLLLALSACRGGQSTLGSGGPAAESLAKLSLFVLLLFSAVAVVMWILLGWVATRRAGTLADHEGPDAGGGHRWILIGGFAIPSLILAVVFVSALGAMDRFPLHDPDDHGPADIRVVGHQWWWQVEYLGGPNDTVTSANEIHIPAGRPIDIQLETADVIHSFWVPRLHGKVDLVPGYRNRIRIEAAQAGTFEGECAEFCGAQHANMRLLVIAHEAREFESWLARERRPAMAAASSEAERGQHLFETGPCALCHTIRGTGARGTVGPDLTHFGSRRGIAANTLPNNKGNLSGWVVHAQAIKPEAAMPNITALTGEELHALVHYLQSLE